MLAEVPADISFDARREAEAKPDDLRGHYETAADVEVRQGAPAREILQAAEAHKADLIMLASQISLERLDVVPHTPFCKSCVNMTSLNAL
ncbi:nucleotide-binding universal stress UspA family protein [Pseudorhizobium tarimense]|uniref:Nucleotide-binding universal stress UspA family protein n=1 Tax=Pseudorhizobium tarimense TaxID=1079109 RepID=A0ABV2H0H8_9HYPH|nr:universal stress protein [Pseudorhizobium tarimense]